MSEIVKLKEKQAVLVWRSFPPMLVRCRVRYLPAKGRAKASWVAFSISAVAASSRWLHYKQHHRLVLGPYVELHAREEGITWARGWNSIEARALRAARMLVSG